MNNSLSLYQRSKDFLWTDRHIAKQMLKLHLDATNDAASRNDKTIDSTVEWIDSVIPEKSSIIDLGCGPGLYSERLSQKNMRSRGLIYRKDRYSMQESRQRRKTCKFGITVKAIYKNCLRGISMRQCAFIAISGR